jgi:NAD(P)-dependent dehydrogenase (short-subunit alcohol dehydrogenase family)
MEDTAMRFQGKVAVVTGTGTSGIGRSVCLALANEGAYVVGIDILHEGNEETCELIYQAGGKGEAVYCDITDRYQVRKVIDEIGTRLGHIDILINNAGFTKTVSFVKDDYDTVVDAYRKCMAVDADGALFTTIASLPYMLKQEQGHIINTLTHLVKLDDIPFRSGFNVYATAKTALWCLNMNFAAEFRDYGIAVNAVCPGPVFTPMMRQYFAERGRPNSFDDIFAVQGRLIRPEDVALAMVNILSWDAKTGPTGRSILLTAREDCTRLSNPNLYNQTSYW